MSFLKTISQSLIGLLEGEDMSTWKMIKAQGCLPTYSAPEMYDRTYNDFVKEFGVTGVNVTDDAEALLDSHVEFDKEYWTVDVGDLKVKIALVEFYTILYDMRNVKSMATARDLEWYTVWGSSASLSLTKNQFFTMLASMEAAMPLLDQRIVKELLKLDQAVTTSVVIYRANAQGPIPFEGVWN